MNETNSNTTHEAPRAIFMIGGPGAGKGYVRTRAYSDVKVLDCDSIKESHPSYDPTRSQDLHEWSRQELARTFFSQIGSGVSFVYDGTGSNADKYVTLMNQAREAGFVIELHYVRCPLTVALERNAKRTRNVPEAIVREKHATIATSFEIVKHYADSVTITENF